MYFYAFSCIFMTMTSSDTRALAKALDNFRKEHGMTQGDLARRLSVSQPHLSRVISGSVPPGDKLRFRIVQLFSERTPEEQTEWLKKVAAAEANSRSFRRLVDAALEILRGR
jgi:transcriptional regulator with XRE-family HTH domain